jgi:hypothetical protein
MQLGSWVKVSLSLILAMWFRLFLVPKDRYIIWLSNLDFDLMNLIPET